MLRELWFLRYPEGVSRAVGDRWYLGTHVQEAKNFVGKVRYLSWRPLDVPWPRFVADIPGATGPSRWDRITEKGYKDMDRYFVRHQGVSPYSPAPWGADRPGSEATMERVMIQEKPQYDLKVETPKV